jgi:hypothetical protein
MLFCFNKKITVLFYGLTLFFTPFAKSGIAGDMNESYFAPVYQSKKAFVNSKKSEPTEQEKDQEKMLIACLQNKLSSFYEVYYKYEKTPHLLREICNPKKGPTPLLWATLSDNPTMVKLLLKFANFNNIFNESVLYWATRLENKEMVKLLLEAGFSPMQRCQHYHEKLRPRELKAKSIKKIILSLHKEQVKETVSSGTPITEAALRKNIAILDLFLEHYPTITIPFFVQKDFDENDIDCSLSPCTAIAISISPLLMAGALYLIDLHRILNENGQIPLSFDVTNYQ